MKNIFSYDSKLVTVFSYIADLFILNLIYLFCCLPVFTIGAAQAGLHTAMRVLQDPEDDSSPYKAFFRGFKSGFFRVTAAWLILAVVEAILVYTFWISYTYRNEGLFVHWAVPLVVLFITLCYQSVVCLFHSRFGCTLPQLLYNGMLMMIWHPLASLLTGILIWAPAAVLAVNPNLYIDLTSAFLTLYYSIACTVIYFLTRKAFKALIDNFNNPDGKKVDAELENTEEAEETQQPEAEPCIAEESDAEESEAETTV